MVSFPPCKINLGLSVIRKRDDGYHDIETCFYPVPLTDVLEVIPSDKLSFGSSGKPIPGDAHDNLCLKAYRLLKDQFDIPPVSIHLHKIIPAGAGLGGGSSDAAHTIRILNFLFDLGIDEQRLMHLAAMLGSDCSFFVQDQPMIGSGRGEVLRLSPVSLKGKYLLLLNPGIHISTAEAYAALTPGIPALPVDSVLAKPVDSWKVFLKNDFEASVLTRFPLVDELRNELYNLGAAYASMSGSGSSVYGIFDDEISTENSTCHSYVVWAGWL
jgi:4-diphosphocytidyl-2-C-methyl-D-erythritol kinase